VVNNVASVQSSIEFKKVALQLEVVPLINSEKESRSISCKRSNSVVPGSNVNISGNFGPNYRYALHSNKRLGAQLLYNCARWVDPGQQGG